MSLTSQVPAQLPSNKDHAVALQAVWWTGFAIATVFIIMRVWARSLSHSRGLDDYVMVASYVLFLTTTILITHVAKTGRTRHLLALGSLPMIDSTLMYYVIILDVGIFLTGLGKVAVGITILRIFGRTSPWQRAAVWVVLILTVGTCFMDFGISTFRCGDPKITWTLELQATATSCISSQTQTDLNLFSNIVQVLADFAFSLIPMVAVGRLRIPKRRKRLLLVALGLTLLTGVAGTAKTVYAATFDVTDLSWAIFPSLICFAVEATLIIVCGSVPVLKPLYERCFPKYRQGDATEVSSKFRSRTYVNSGGRGFSKTSNSKVKEGSMTETFVGGDLSLDTLHQSQDFQTRPHSSSLELARLDDYPVHPARITHESP